MAEMKQFGIDLELDDAVAQGHYSNLAIISHSTSEFIIDFAAVLPGVQKARVKSRIILTPEHAKRLLRSLQENIVRSAKSNFMDIPTDCPQRDERMGWLGDRAMGCIGESFMFRHALLYEKWLKDIEQIQSENGCVPDVAPAFWTFDQHSGNVTWPAAYILSLIHI